MTEEELERTTMMKSMIIESDPEDDDLSILEQIEEFEDKIDYLDITSDKKNKLRELCQKIKEEESDTTREYLFKLLQKEID
jgi:hypothetical protein